MGWLAEWSKCMPPNKERVWYVGWIPTPPFFLGSIPTQLASNPAVFSHFWVKKSNFPKKFQKWWGNKRNVRGHQLSIPDIRFN